MFMDKDDTLRQQSNKVKQRSENKPIIIYGVVILAIVFSLLLRWFDVDLSLNILSEIIGAAFTIFVIEELLVKNKTKRWLVVQEHVEYLIGRTINRIRDGIATRVFLFKPEIDNQISEEQVLLNIRLQREKFLNELSVAPNLLAEKINPGFFVEDNYDYFNEKADDIWKLINMKYSEYMEPSLVSLLIELHTHMADVCSHIRMYGKSEKFPEEREYYQSAARNGVANSMKEMIRIVIVLKKEGYSDSVRIIN
jgi:hypothetical protein